MKRLQSSKMFGHAPSAELIWPERPKPILWKGLKAGQAGKRIEPWQEFRVVERRARPLRHGPENFSSQFPPLLQSVFQPHISNASMAPQTAGFLGFCHGGLRVGERNDPRIRSPQPPNSPKLGGSLISPSSSIALNLARFVGLRLGGFQQADRLGKGTRSPIRLACKQREPLMSGPLG